MNTNELQELLEEKGLTPEQIIKIVERYERNKERVRKYQKEKYYKVSVSVKKEVVNKLQNITGLEREIVKKYLAGMKLIHSVNQEDRKKIREAMNNSN
jgi:predicted solute-binding protein